MVRCCHPIPVGYASCHQPDASLASGGLSLRVTDMATAVGLTTVVVMAALSV